MHIVALWMHTLFRCTRWIEARENFTEEPGLNLETENLMRTLLQSAESHIEMKEMY